MATLTIRDVPDKERDRLRKQAAANGRSMEAEARRIILEGLAKPKLAVEETVARVQALMKAPRARAVSRLKAGTAGKSKPGRDLLTPKERRVLKPDAQAALQRLREMFGDRKGEARGSMVDSFLGERRSMWGEE